MTSSALIGCPRGVTDEARQLSEQNVERRRTISKNMNQYGMTTHHSWAVLDKRGCIATSAEPRLGRIHGLSREEHQEPRFEGRLSPHCPSTWSVVTWSLFVGIKGKRDSACCVVHHSKSRCPITRPPLPIHRVLGQPATGCLYLCCVRFRFSCSFSAAERTARRLIGTSSRIRH